MRRLRHETILSEGGGQEVSTIGARDKREFKKGMKPVNMRMNELLRERERESAHITGLKDGSVVLHRNTQVHYFLLALQHHLQAAQKNTSCVCHQCWKQWKKQQPTVKVRGQSYLFKWHLRRSVNLLLTITFYCAHVKVPSRLKDGDKEEKEQYSTLLLLSVSLSLSPQISSRKENDECHDSEAEAED